MSSETFTVLLNVSNHLQEIFHRDLECLQMCHTTVNLVSIEISQYTFKHYSNYTVRPRKKETHKSSNFSENCNDLSEKVYIVTKFSLSFLLTPVIRCIGHAWARIISNGDLKIDLRRMGIKGLTGSATFQNKGKCWQDILLFLLSCFFCLDALFWHGLASLNLVISTKHHYSAQIDFELHEFKLFLFIHALRYHVFGIKWKKWKCPW